LVKAQYALAGQIYNAFFIDGPFLIGCNFLSIDVNTILAFQVNDKKFVSVEQELAMFTGKLINGNMKITGIGPANGNDVLGGGVELARHIGRGENIWSNVHLDDLIDLYLLALERAPAGALYYAENGENSMREVCAAIGRALGLGERTEGMTVEEAAAEWGEGAARYTMGSNSRVRAVRARRELGWAPHRPSLLEDIAHGSYGEAA
jgi:hypothetical protein